MSYKKMMYTEEYGLTDLIRFTFNVLFIVLGCWLLLAFLKEFNFIEGYSFSDILWIFGIRFFLFSRTNWYLVDRERKMRDDNYLNWK